MGSLGRSLGTGVPVVFGVLTDIDTATKVPVFEALRNSLPKLVSTGAIPVPRELTGKLYKRLLRDEYKEAYEKAQAGA